jgi:DNA-binding NtrC family response regulator
MNKIKVLLVDDEQEFVSTLAERLEFRDIETLVAMNGDQALRMIEEHKPPLVVLDVLMPGIGGLDVLKRIKRKHPEIQVILLTGHGSTKDGIKGMHQGAFDYLMKPVNIEELIHRMNEALEPSKLRTR